jgi:hypothetical protein
MQEIKDLESKLAHVSIRHVSGHKHKNKQAHTLLPEIQMNIMADSWRKEA